jgi:hypothetical protein
VSSQMRWRQVRAKLLARSGDDLEAERLGREAVSLARETDMLNWHGNALADLADVLAFAGRSADAAAELDRAISLYRLKGNVVSAERAGLRLSELRAVAPSGG